MDNQISIATCYNGFTCGPIIDRRTMGMEPPELQGGMLDADCPLSDAYAGLIYLNKRGQLVIDEKTFARFDYDRVDCTINFIGPNNHLLSADDMKILKAEVDSVFAEYGLIPLQEDSGNRAADFLKSETSRRQKAGEVVDEKRIGQLASCRNHNYAWLTYHFDKSKIPTLAKALLEIDSKGPQRNRQLG